MAVLVQKYGGSSVADVEKIGIVADKVVAAKRAGNDVVVVVSAMGKTTDSLLALAKSVTKPGESEAPRRELDMLLSTGERVTMVDCGHGGHCFRGVLHFCGSIGRSMRV